MIPLPGQQRPQTESENLGVDSRCGTSMGRTVQTLGLCRSHLHRHQVTPSPVGAMHREDVLAFGRARQGSLYPGSRGHTQGSGVQGGAQVWAVDVPGRKGGFPRGREASGPLQGQAVCLKEVRGQ